MKGILKLTKSTLLMFLLLGTAAIYTGCSDDPVQGCTDSASENYNANAEEDDGTCVYARDKFIGVYDGSSDCEGALVIPTLTNPALTFEVAPKVGDNVSVQVSLPIQGVPVAFDATVEGNNLTVDALLTGLPFPNPANPMETIMVDIKADGVMVYDSSNNSTTGTISLKISSTATGSTLDKGGCLITGVKQ